MQTFTKGARVCFVGDSLVAMNQTLPRIIDYYNKKFPERKVQFFNCGTSGGTYKSAIDFVYDDVLIHNPTHAVVAFGVNDSDRGSLGAERSDERYERLKNAYEQYKENVKKYTDILKENGVEVILCTPAIYDEYTDGSEKALKGGYALILGYAEFIRAFAKENGYELCDYHSFMTEAVQVQEQKVYSEDRVHPTEHGFYLMAKCFLSFQGQNIGKEEPIPTYLDEWRQEVDKLRTIYGAEHMIINDYNKSLDEKLSLMQGKVVEQDWGQPVFERFIRAYIKYKPIQAQLYEEIDKIYAKTLMGLGE